MKNWFKDIHTLDELKAEYRRLAIIHHPDKGGKTEDMQEINAEFDRLFPVYKIRLNTQSAADAQTHETAETVRREFYTANGWKGVNYDANRDLKTIAASVRKYVKDTYPAYRFSVRTAYASMCQELRVDMKEAPVPVYKTIDQLTRDDVSGIIRKANHNNVWRLTCWSDPEARAEIARIWETEGDWYKIIADEIRAVAADVDDFVNSFNRSDCDGMIDYFDVNFYYFGCLDGNGRYIKHVPREDKRKKLLADDASATTQSAPAKAPDVAPATVQRVEFCAEHDGLEVYFTGKPSDDLRAALKADGWRWHSVKKCWYNRNTEQHLQTLRELTA